MSRPKLEDAVLLVVDRLYVEKFHPALLIDVVRGVARVYRLPDESHTQMINETRLQEGKLARPDGQELKFVSSDERMSLRDAVRSKTIWLGNHGYVEIQNEVV